MNRPRKQRALAGTWSTWACALLGGHEAERLLESSAELPQRLNSELPQGEAKPLPGINPEELKAGDARAPCSQQHVTATRGAGAIDFLLFLSLFFCLWLGWVSFDVWASLAAASRGASSLQHTGSLWQLSQCCSWWLPWRLPWRRPWRLLVTAALGGSSGAARGGS